MVKNTRLRQRALERKKKKRTRALEHKRAHTQSSTGWPSAEQVRWPVMECLVSAGWANGRSLATVIVARRQGSRGPVAMATFLMDLQCLGGKNAFACLVPLAQYRSTSATTMKAQGALAISLDLAAKIVHEGLAYARGLGFAPHPDVARTMPMLYGAHPENCAERVPLGGPDGKPLFIQGPNDDAERILDQLNRRVGSGDYDLVMGGEFGLDDDLPQASR